jgi:hypothetical protein
MFSSILFHLLDLSSDKPAFDIEAGTQCTVLHNAARHAVTATLRLESDAPCTLRVGTGREVECAAGQLVVCIAVAAGTEEVSVELHSIVAVSV